MVCRNIRHHDHVSSLRAHLCKVLTFLPPFILFFTSLCSFSIHLVLISFQPSYDKLLETNKNS